MTIGLVESTFLVVVNAQIRIYGASKIKKNWGYEFDFLGLRDVIGHVTIGLGICGFLLAAH